MRKVTRLSYFSLGYSGLSSCEWFRLKVPARLAGIVNLSNYLEPLYSFFCDFNLRLYRKLVDSDLTYKHSIVLKIAPR